MTDQALSELVKELSQRIAKLEQQSQQHLPPAFLEALRLYINTRVNGNFADAEWSAVERANEKEQT